MIGSRNKRASVFGEVRQEAESVQNTEAQTKEEHQFSNLDIISTF